MKPTGVKAASSDGSGDADEVFLRTFGERIRSERARRGMSRRLLADHAGISERYLSQLESGKGNVSILLIRRVATALGLPIERLVAVAGASPEMALIQQFLARLTPAQLHQAHSALLASLAEDADASRARRIALVGLRGAGKTTLGRGLAAVLSVPFVELDREIERIAGSALGSIIELYGQQAYRRYELQALEELLGRETAFVVATGGSLVSEAATYALLLDRCYTVWVKTTPQEHMNRVLAQGDLRPMADSKRAMEDLRRILDERSELYRRADAAIETAGRSEQESLRELATIVAPLPAAK